MYIYVLLLILFFVLLEFIGYKKEQPILKIKNSSIEFYEKGKRVFVSKRDDLRKFIYKPFFPAVIGLGVGYICLP